MECPICFNLIENSCVGSCMHHYCYTCLVNGFRLIVYAPRAKSLY